ncbi:FapA family protein [Chrysiogenes arsenatis]|uniref:FapA family protein n=1 Tax=Chrysiogenes arsenatis TaxID=309797 RepID=UPI0003F626CF|nr:FapA family protein [Chrysiogenes arsenatis]
MKLLWADQLEPKMRLARDIYKGTTLFLPRTAPINERVIAQLLSTGYNQKIAVDNGIACPIRRSLRGYEIEVVEKDHGILYLSGNVYVESFVQAESSLFCEGDLEIEGDVLAFASVMCTGTLKINGSIIGGTAMAGNRLIVASAGSTMTPLPTALGCTSYVTMLNREALHTLARDSETVRENVARISASMAIFSRKQKAGIPLDTSEKVKLKKLLEVYTALRKQDERLRDQMNELHNIAVDPSILITKSIYEDVACRIDDVAIELKPSAGPIKVRMTDGKITFSRCNL